MHRLVATQPVSTLGVSRGESTVRDRGELQSVSMSVATADETKLLFLEFQSAGVTFHQTLKKQPWGAKNFIVKDPDAGVVFRARKLIVTKLKPVANPWRIYPFQRATCILTRLRSQDWSEHFPHL